MPQVVLISTYELGRQPFGLASPAAWLKAAGATVNVQDLAVSDFDAEAVRDAELVGVYVPMHTATRLAAQVLARVRSVNQRVHICAYGLYASMNVEFLHSSGVDSVIGGEFEEPLVDLYRSLQGSLQIPPAQKVYLQRQHFMIPDRAGLPDLGRYAALRLPSGETRTVGYTEATRGCKHLCRHCPIVPVYGGRFRVVQAATVLADIRQQVQAGARHITFGDPDFLNAPTHSLNIVSALHQEFPDLSYDATIKVEHLNRYAHLLPALRETGCVLVTTAVESTDDTILARLDKQHTAADLENVLQRLRAIGLALNPTFVAFTPWTTLENYAHFLTRVQDLDLVDSIAPVQYGIRLLIPSGSRILELDEIRPLLAGFDPAQLAYPWSNPDPRVDLLQREIVQLVRTDQQAGHSRRHTFASVWGATFDLLGDNPGLQNSLLHQEPTTAQPPQMTEQWYCCAEPTDEQLAHL